LVCGHLGVATLFVVTACGGDNDHQSQQPPPVTIRGGERLAWNQVADSIPQLRSLTFRLYVDGQESPLSSPQCDETIRPTGFECSAGLPSMTFGQHALELTSVSGGVESLRSPQLLVIVAGAAPTNAVSSLEQSRRIDSTVCWHDPQAACYSVQVIASDLGRVTAMSATPDGRVILIESGKRVRIIARDALGATIALPPEGDRQLTGLALDTDFEESRSVFVAWTELARGVPGLNVTRYRELENRLGEAATIVTALHIAADVMTPLAVDDEGLVYLALPVDRTGSERRFLGEAGAVMRFDRDGLVPRSNQHASAIVAEGYAVPLALAIDRPTRAVWLTGRDRQQLGPIAGLEIPSVNRGPWPSRPVAVKIRDAENEAVESLAIVSQQETSIPGTRLFVATGGRLRDVALTPWGAITSIAEVPIDDRYVPHTVAADTRDSLYVGVETHDGTDSVLKFTRLTR